MQSTVQARQCIVLGQLVVDAFANTCRFKVETWIRKLPVFVCDGEGRSILTFHNVSLLNVPRRQPFKQPSIVKNDMDLPPIQGLEQILKLQFIQV
jgi:hypothetical protein